ncbi:AAA family ATPase [Rhizobium sp. R86522]|uniref:AAA family ATPase n=1 Tax=Rhizobium sp. R86522 TaxID=3093861 RepID=UPI003671E714
MENAVVISGCSGGGKSTLIAELSRRGFAVVSEPGRRDREQAHTLKSRWIFFDRSLVDAYAALADATRDISVTESLLRRDRYHPTVFLTPPWPEIYREDAERRHDFEAAVTEFERLATIYPALGYSLVLLPKAPVEDRADFLLAKLSGN